MTIASTLCTAVLAATIAAPLGTNLLRAQEQQTAPPAPSYGRSVPQAPVGHRQPRVADIPPAAKSEADLREEQRQAELTRKLRICRGC